MCKVDPDLKQKIDLLQIRATHIEHHINHMLSLTSATSVAGQDVLRWMYERLARTYEEKADLVSKI